MYKSTNEINYCWYIPVHHITQSTRCVQIRRGISTKIYGIHSSELDQQYGNRYTDLLFHIDQ